MNYDHKTGTARENTQPTTDLPADYTQAIRIPRGKTIENKVTRRRRIIDYSIETKGKDTNDICFQIEFQYDGQVWLVDWSDCSLT